MSRAPETEKLGRTTRYVTFRLAEEIYAVDVMQIREVLRVGEIAPVPGAPSHVLGIINLRGTVVTVIDARTRMGLPSRPADEASRVIIIEGAGQVMGMLVDSVTEVVELADSAIEPPPEVGGEEQSRYFRGVTSRQGGLTIVVDLDRLLGDAGASAA